MREHKLFVPTTPREAAIQQFLRADLMILWSDEARYRWYAEGIREEYAHTTCTASAGPLSSTHSAPSFTRTSMRRNRPRSGARRVEKGRTYRRDVQSLTVILQRGRRGSVPLRR